MGGFLDKVMGLIGYQEETVEEDEIFPAGGEEGRRRRGHLVSLPSAKMVDQRGREWRVVVVAIDQFDEVQLIADHLKAHRPVVANLLNLEREVAKRVVDFLNGTVYALDGHVQKVSEGIFVFTPAEVEIDAEHALSLHDSGMYFLRS